jgi:hypothetical protein
MECLWKAAVGEEIVGMAIRMAPSRSECWRVPVHPAGFGDYSLTPARMGLVEHVLGIPIVKDEAKLEGVPRSIFWELFEPFAVRMGSHGAHGAVRRPEPIGPGGIVLDVEDSDVVFGAGILIPGAGTT